MITINKNSASFIISDVILQQEDDFTDNDIVEKVKHKVIDQFASEKEMEDYIKNKLDDMCKYGLIGKTMLYYFSV